MQIIWLITVVLLHINCVLSGDTCRNVVYHVQTLQQVSPCGNNSDTTDVIELKNLVKTLQQRLFRVESRIPVLERKVNLLETEVKELTLSKVTTGSPRPTAQPVTSSTSVPVSNGTKSIRAWYPLNKTSLFVQYKFLTSNTFTVPPGVTKVDVICIGGGGGGRDSHSPFTHRNSMGGNGGTSSFGSYIYAHGGRGAKADNSGGGGGWGSTASGGQGGAGGGCSAGAGAAGETSPGDGSLVPGSTTNPFCGGGASTYGSACSGKNPPRATSGPGGVPGRSRNGAKYGGGGGSRAGGRTGGGGGYSRAVVNVTPGERILITVGAAGSPAYASPGPGIVVVSAHGTIEPLGRFSSN